MLTLLLVGCNKNNNNPVITHSITAIELKTIMAKNKIYTPNAFVADQTYALPSENWIKTEYSSALYSFLTSFKSSQWTSEENDCDNFASMSYSFSQILHHNTPSKLEKSSLAFGEFWYITKNGGGHAINVLITWAGENQYKVLFYEPQLQQIIALDKDEIDSCLFYRF